MSIQKIIFILGLSACSFILLSGSDLFAQFSGSFQISGYRSTNVEGRDSATPDNIFNPSIDLLYNWDISNPLSLKLEATITPNLYQEVKSRSFIKNFVSATANYYLSDISNKAKIATIPSPPALNLQSQIKPNLSEEPKLLPKSDIIIAPAMADVPHIASTKLALISELLDSFEISKRGLSDDSINIASDIKDSVSESILALSDILANQIYTESIATVISSEIGKQKDIFSQVPLPEEEKTKITKLFDEVRDVLNSGKPQSDILPLPKLNVTVETPSMNVTAGSPEANDILLEALTHIQSEAENAALGAGEDSPLITLVNSQTELKEFSSQDILLQEDITPLSSKTLATLFSLPFSFETQNNKGAYIGYSYKEWECNPRFDLFFGKKFGLGVTYDLMNTNFPNDSAHLNDGTVNKLRLDSRIEISPGFMIAPELGIGFKSYNKAIEYLKFSPVKGRPGRPDTMLVTTPTGYHHFFVGGAAVGFPGNSLCFGFSEALTRSSDLRPYIYDSLLTQNSRVGGTSTDDEYSYELTRESFFFLWNAFWDIRFSFDLAYENRHYANVEIGRRSFRLPTTNIQRDDHGPVIDLNLSREFLFDSRLISIFSSFVPSLNFQYSDFTSSVAQFNYKDMTSTLSFEFDF